jgi:hypothetical protein
MTNFSSRISHLFCDARVLKLYLWFPFVYVVEAQVDFAARSEGDVRVKVEFVATVFALAISYMKFLSVT